MKVTICTGNGCHQLKLPDQTPEQSQAFQDAWQHEREQGRPPDESPTVQALASGQMPLFNLRDYQRPREH